MLLAVLILLLASMNPHSAGVVNADEDQSRRYVLIWKNNSADRVGGVTYAVGNPPNRKQPPFVECKVNLTGLTNLLDEPCNDLGDRVSFLVNSMSPCEIDKEVSCISRVETSENGLLWLPARYQTEIRPPTYDWKSAPSIDLSMAYVGGIYVTAEGELLAVKATYLYPRSVDPTTAVQVLSVVKNQVDYPRVSDDYDNKNCLQDSRIYRRGDNWRNELLSPPVSECLVQIPTKRNIRVTLDLRWQPSGWIHTQIENAKVSISQVGVRSLVTVEGSSAQIPEYRATFDSKVADDVRVWCALKETIQWLASDPQGFCGGAPQLPSTYPQLSLDVDTLGGRGGALNPVTTFNRLVQLRPEASRAVSENMTWRFLMKPREFRNYSLGKCLEQGFVGSVGGNSMAIESTIPIWSKKDSTLNFVVGSPHLTSKGDVATGSYELQIREDSAKCLWGVRVTPQNVQISVVDQDGVAKVAVATVSVRDGMIRFSATGFTYSTARFRIGLATSSKKKTQCRRGSQRLTLKSGVKRCPTGWRKT